MLALKYLLMILSLGIFATAAGIVAYDVYQAMQLNWLLSRKRAEEQGAEVLSPLGPGTRHPFGPVRWRLGYQLALIGLVPLLLALSITVVPDGSAGIRISQFSGVRPGTLYPGVHLLTPLVDSSCFMTRGNRCSPQRQTTLPSPAAKPPQKFWSCKLAKDSTSA